MHGAAGQADLSRVIATLEGFSAKLATQRYAVEQPQETPRNLEVKSALAVARSLIHSRCAAQAAFPHDIFQDPAFDILLTLFISGEEGHKMPISAVVMSGGTPPTTGLRWVTKLEKLGMLLREDDPFDKRRQLLSLTEETRERMLQWLTPLPPL